MQFGFAFVSLLAVAVAQSSTAPAAAQGSANAFNIPEGQNYLLSAGTPYTFTWSNPTQGTVTIYLAEGANSNLQRVATLASSIANSGSYTYNVPSDIVEGANYALEIVDDSDTSIVNYTPQFVIQSPIHAVQTSGGSTSLLTVGATPTGSTASVTSALTMTTAAGATNGTASHSGSAASSGAASTGTAAAASASRTSGAAASGTPPSTGSAQSVKAASGLLALALGFAVVL